MSSQKRDQSFEISVSSGKKHSKKLEKGLFHQYKHNGHWRVIQSFAIQNQELIWIEIAFFFVKINKLLKFLFLHLSPANLNIFVRRTSVWRFFEIEMKQEFP
jgi:hypothetical protein